MASNVVADLNDLLAEVNEVGPDRDRTTDGAIGDQAHKDRSSDHNLDDTPGSRTPHTDPDNIPEVHARDFDSSGPYLDKSITTDKVVHVVVAKMRTLGHAAPLNYVIWNRQIFEYPDFSPAPYTGSDPHTNHWHASSRYGSGSGSSNPENYTGSWGLREAFLMLTPDDKNWITAQLEKAVAGLLNLKIKDAAYPNRTVGDRLRDDAKLRGYLIGDEKDTENANLKGTAPIVQMALAAAPDEPDTTPAP